MEFIINPVSLTRHLMRNTKKTITLSLASILIVGASLTADVASARINFMSRPMQAHTIRWRVPILQIRDDPYG